MTGARCTIVRDVAGAEYGRRFDCPGCGKPHVVPTVGPTAWGYNGSLDQPSFTPSILVRYRHPKGHDNDNPAPSGFAGEYVEDVCHSFVTDGRIAYCGDSTHALAGQTDRPAGGHLMQYYRCKCGKSTCWTSMGVSPCASCKHCGSDYAQGPDDHSEPAPHEYVTKYDQNTGVPYEICKRCLRRRTSIEAPPEPEPPPPPPPPPTAYELLVRDVGQPAHCDELVLHMPGTCEYCDDPKPRRGAAPAEHYRSVAREPGRAMISDRPTLMPLAPDSLEDIFDVDAFVSDTDERSAGHDPRRGPHPTERARSVHGEHGA